MAWTVEMRPGDRVYVWRAAGRKRGVAGVIASGWLHDEPRVRGEDSVAQTLWRRGPPKQERRVWIDVDRVASPREVLQARWLGEDPVLGGLRVLRLRSETNYLLTREQADRLAHLWERIGQDWSRAESIAGLWAYHHTYGGPVSRTSGSPVAIVAARIGRVVPGVYNKVMNFRAIDQRDDREGLSGGSAVDQAVWDAFYDVSQETLRGAELDAEFDRPWGAEAGPAPDALTIEEAVRVSTGRRGQGFISDPRVRKAVEERAMDLAKRHYAAIFVTDKEPSIVQVPGWQATPLGAVQQAAFQALHRGRYWSADPQVL